MVVFVFLNGTQYARPKNGDMQYAKREGVSPFIMYCAGNRKSKFHYTKQFLENKKHVEE